MRADIHLRRWLVIGIIGLAAVGCQIGGATPAAPVEVTRLVPYTQIVIPQIVEVTRIVPATPIEVTRVVTVTQSAPQVVMAITRIVEVTQLVVVTQNVEPPAPIPAPTQAPAYVPALVNPDLLVWYDFEGDFYSSGTVADRSGNGFNALVVGGVGADYGISDSQAIAFNGDGYLQAQANPAAGRRAVSISLWFKTDHPEENYKFASAAWWSNGPASGWVMATHMPEFWSDNTTSLYFPEMTINDNNFPDDEWVHEVVTYDGSRIREYTNGLLVNDWPTTGEPLGRGQAMVIGGWPSNGFFYEGSLDEFRMYGWGLSTQDVRTLYDEGP